MPDENPQPNEFVILVDFPDQPQEGLMEASRGNRNAGQLVEKSKEALDKAMDTIAAMAQRAAGLGDRIPAEFTEAEITFGVKLDYEAGALLTKAGAEGSLSVKLTWERKAKADE
jgi:hypothetical protein